MRSDPRNPICMTPQESAAWWQADALIRGERTHAVSPCSDCYLRFAEGMRLVNRCDGHYPGEFVVLRVAPAHHGVATSTCAQCGATFTRENSGAMIYCSRQCNARAQSRPPCVACGSRVSGHSRSGMCSGCAGTGRPVLRQASA